MSDQHYATPVANLTEGIGNCADLIEPLLATRPWLKLCSILGFIFTGFMLLAAVGMFLGGSVLSSAAQTGDNGLTVPPLGLIGVVYLLMAVLYFVPSLFLFKCASSISIAEVSQSVTDIGEALKMQKSFWKFVGIVALVMVVFMILGIGLAIFLPMMT